MNESKAYLEVTERFLNSCEQHLHHKINIQEVIAFKCYHAFESLAGAFNSKLGHKIPISHPKKLNLFIQNCRGMKNSQNISTLAIFLSSRRNIYLYPNTDQTGYITPKDQITVIQAKRLVSRVKGILQSLRPNL